MIIQFLTGLGILLFGVNIMSSAFEKICGTKIRRTISKYGKNIYKNSFFGCFLTILLQSSTASIVLILGLTGVGATTLLQSISLIIGSNIASALNTIIIAFQSIDIIAYFGLLTLLGIIMRLVFKNNNVKNWGMCLSGLGLIFVGLSLMSSAITNLSSSANFVDFVSSINNPWLLFVIGIVFSALLNSPLGTTATIATILAISPAVLSIQNAAYLIYGMNIGTCITLLIIGASTNIETFKAGLFHLLFNVCGSILFCLISLFDWITPVLGWINNPTLEIIMINIIFNTVTALIVLPLAPAISKLLDRCIKSKKQTQNQEISDMPTLGLIQLNSNALNLFHDTCDCLETSMLFVGSSAVKDIEKTKTDVQKIIEESDEMIKQLFKLPSGTDVDEDEKLELNVSFIGIAKTNVNTLKLIESCEIDKTKVEFTQKQLSLINKIVELMVSNLEDMRNILNEKFNHLDVDYSSSIENILNRLEGIVQLKIKAKKNVISDTIIAEKNVKKYTAFLNVINYFEEINTNLTDIILSTSTKNYEEKIKE